MKNRDLASKRCGEERNYLLYNQSMAQKTRLQKYIEILRQQRSFLAEQFNVATLELFGSYVRHEERASSDLDILVTFTITPSLLKFLRLENYLSDILGIKVDLVMKDSLKPELGKNILREAVPV
jgi:predicted nucleotidyltransferase